MTDYRLVPAGDAALIVEFEDRIDPIVNRRAIRLAEAMGAARVGGVRDIVPTYRSVAIFYDPLRTDYDGLVRRVEIETAARDTSATESHPPLEIPVCYGGDFGPDLHHVANVAELSETEVVERHTRQTYRVFMMGFVPGFAYLGSVDARIAVPRLEVPRVRVPAGSVGIAGMQTGIYPSETPGGWQLVGRTPVRMFDPSRDEPFFLKPGDAVRFRAIGRDEYERICESR